MLCRPPIVLLAFANNRIDPNAHLRDLSNERKAILAALEPLIDRKRIEVVDLPNATRDEIFEVFTKKKGKIVLFHFGGHADDSTLVLEDEKGAPDPLANGGLTGYLAKQDVDVVFLNGCATEQQTEQLRKGKATAMISTSRAILDDVATEFASQFYAHLLHEPLGKAFSLAEAATKTKPNAGSRPMDAYRGAGDDEDAGQYREILFSGPEKKDEIGWPWKLEADDRAEQWRLVSFCWAWVIVAIVVLAVGVGAFGLLGPYGPDRSRIDWPDHERTRVKLLKPDVPILNSCPGPDALEGMLPGTVEKLEAWGERLHENPKGPLRVETKGMPAEVLAELSSLDRTVAALLGECTDEPSELTFEVVFEVVATSDVRTEIRGDFGVKGSAMVRTASIVNLDETGERYEMTLQTGRLDGELGIVFSNTAFVVEAEPVRFDGLGEPLELELQPRTLEVEIPEYRRFGAGYVTLIGLPEQEIECVSEDGAAGSCERSTIDARKAGFRYVGRLPPKITVKITDDRNHVGTGDVDVESSDGGSASTAKALVESLHFQSRKCYVVDDSAKGWRRPKNCRRLKKYSSKTYKSPVAIEPCSAGYYWKC